MSKQGAAAGAETLQSSTGDPARRAFRLQFKTTLAMMALLIGAVAVCGVVSYVITKNMLRHSRETQVRQFAYGVAASIGAGGMSEPRELRETLARLDHTPNLDFVSVTDTELIPMAAFTAAGAPRQQFDNDLRAVGTNISASVSKVREVSTGGDRVSLVVTVPIFTSAENGKQTLRGYLHAGFASDLSARLRFLQGLMVLTCLGVALVAVPVAALVARHVTVPIQKLAGAAHRLAQGDLGHRVSLMRRDELGELADAFNRMAYTVQTQQEEIREANAVLEEKVQKRTAELEKVNNRLTSEMSEKEDFLRAVSHDLNAPLRNISGMASMLMIKYKDTLEKDAMQRLERIQKNVEVECELIGELLELSRLKSRREKIEAVDLHELIGAVADQFSSDFETRKITFRVAGRLPVMQAERGRMRQVFQNLIDNAVKYMRDEGPREIGVAMRWEEGELILSFTDTGLGIPADDIPHLFHVFRRAKNASAMKIPGKGVGLASVKSIIENYGGRLWVESEYGAGTTFHIGIPRHCFDMMSATPPGKPADVSTSQEAA